MISAVPLASSAGVNVRSPLPASTVTFPLNNAAFVFPVTWKESTWPASFAGPLLIAVAQPVTVCDPASSSTVTSPPGVKLGTSLADVTVIATLSVSPSAPPLPLLPWSLVTIVSVDEPLKSRFGL